MSSETGQGAYPAETTVICGFLTTILISQIDDKKVADDYTSMELQDRCPF